jgi:hypothetical protein
MDYSDRQLALFSFIQNLGFEPSDTLRMKADPEFIEITVRGAESNEEVTHKLNLHGGQD